MKPLISHPLLTQALRIGTLAALFLGISATDPAYGQDLDRERMVALHNQLTFSKPPALEHSERSMFASGKELLDDGGFENGYYGGSQYGSQGTTGSWGWWNALLHPDGSLTYAASANPIWQNYGGVNARTGQFMAYFNPFGPSGSELHQTLLIPSGNTATLSFWLKIGATASSSSSDKLYVCFRDYDKTAADPGCPVIFSAADAVGFSWVHYSYDVSRVAGKSMTLLFQATEVGTTLFQVDDISVTTTSPLSSDTCTEDAFTMCLGGGRYRVTSTWQNQYAGDTRKTALKKTALTDVVGAFWIDAGAYQYFVSVNPATAAFNGHTWVAMNTFSGVEFWINVTDTVSGLHKEYHNPPENKTLVEDRTFFVYP